VWSTTANKHLIIRRLSLHLSVCA